MTPARFAPIGRRRAIDDRIDASRFSRAGHGRLQCVTVRPESRIANRRAATQPPLFAFEMTHSAEPGRGREKGARARRGRVIPAIYGHEGSPTAGLN